MFRSIYLVLGLQSDWWNRVPVLVVLDVLHCVSLLLASASVFLLVFVVLAFRRLCVITGSCAGPFGQTRGWEDFQLGKRSFFDLIAHKLANLKTLRIFEAKEPPVG